MAFTRSRVRDAGRLVAIALLMCSMCMASAIARAATHEIDITSPDLADALTELARAADLELLFDRTLVAGKPAPPLRGVLDPDEALRELLRGSGVSFRRTETGAYLLFSADPTGPPVDPHDTGEPRAPPINEMLIVGHRTQNTDIPRTVDDIQAYQVTAPGAIQRAQSSSVDDFVRTRLSANTHQLADNQAAQDRAGSVISKIDIRGLGFGQTLVLVDGRRMPTVIAPLDLMAQTDLNGLSVAAVERIEALGAPAGGIYGVGASGGMVNVVLEREFDGAEFSVTNNISGRGDAWRRAADVRLGYTHADTGTHVMLRAGASRDDGLEFQDRDFVERARKLRHARRPGLQESYTSNSINIVSVFGDALTFAPEYGGASLNAVSTFLPLDAPAATTPEGLDILLANAGKYDSTLSPDGQGKLQSLLTPMRAFSGAATLRQEFGGRIEAYADYLWMQDEGRATTPATDPRGDLYAPGEPGNPFNQTLWVSAPTAGVVGKSRAQSRSERLTAGLIARLGRGWAANLDYAWGHAAQEYASSEAQGGHGVISNFRFDLSQSPRTLGTQLSNIFVAPARGFRASAEMQDATVRAAGPLLDLPGGPLTLNIDGEHRHETQRGGRIRQDVSSLFIEARAPVLADNRAAGPLRGMEIQLAVRADRYRLGLTPDQVERVNRSSILAETIGARVRPVPGLMVRASFSSGFTPPAPWQLIGGSFDGSDGFGGWKDPKRGGIEIPSDAPYTVFANGSIGLRAQRTVARTFGVVLQPETLPGLRFSIDYSRLRTTHEIVDNETLPDIQYFLDHEEEYPGRISRQPLTAEDVAAGYTGGRIISIDHSFLQTGRSDLEAVDFAFDYDWRFFSNDVHLYSQVTWQPTLRRHSAPNYPTYNLVGHADGPLRWRGNFGVDWTRGDWSSGINLQAYDGYRSTFAAPLSADDLRDLLLLGQSLDYSGPSRIRPQAYLDWTVAFTSKQRLARIDYRLGIKNVLDSRPPVIGNVLGAAARQGFLPIDYNPNGGYSPYGDPRGRRVELTVSAEF